MFTGNEVYMVKSRVKVATAMKNELWSATSLGSAQNVSVTGTLSSTAKREVL